MISSFWNFKDYSVPLVRNISANPFYRKSRTIIVGTPVSSLTVRLGTVLISLSLSLWFTINDFSVWEWITVLAIPGTKYLDEGDVLCRVKEREDDFLSIFPEPVDKPLAKALGQEMTAAPLL